MMNPLMNSQVFGGRKYRFEAGCDLIPHPEKEYKGGEDALLVRDNLLAVTDGVGGWAEKGVDPALYAKNLCKLIGQLYDQNRLYYQDYPDELIQAAVSLNPYPGTSTVTICALNESTGKLKVAYIGDSLMSVYTNGHQQFKSREQTKGFNFPYQVGLKADNPMQCIREEGPLLQGSIVIVGSDGIWDNVFDQEILATVRSSYEMEVLARTLSVSAFAHSSNPNSSTPFSTRAYQSGVVYNGGKPDDIAVIAARVVLR